MDWILPLLLVANAGLVTAWMAGAIYYDLCGGAKWGRWVAVGWVVGVIVLFALWQPLWQPFAVLLGVLVLFLGWWLRLKPSHDREWDPSVAVMPRAVREGDVVTIENVRNFEYRSLDDFTPRYETRTYHLANLKGADIVFFNWGIALMSHPVLVFDFGPDGFVCMSIEVRFRRGQRFSIMRSLYRQQELIFLVADERDVILRRTKHGRPQDARLYRFKATPEEVRSAFLDYVAAINSLYETPRWYHGLCANCTTSFYRLPNSRRRLDWRVLANGRLDRALYEDGRLDRSLPFPELHRIAYLNELANSAPEAGFGEHIRRELEMRRHER
jgi:hypothetical protein